MGGRIEAFFDISSPYSYMAFTYLLKNRDVLKTYDVTVDFIPIFLGGINVGSGNKPPWSLPVKAAYGRFDFKRSQAYHGLYDISSPDFFPPLTLLTQRGMNYIKENYPEETFLKAWLVIYQKLWTPPQQDVTKPDVFYKVLLESKIFTEEEVSRILKAAGEKKWKDRLLERTQEVLDKGAFGAPWFWVRNAEGKEEPFFGSDRFHFMFEFLGLDWQDFKLLPKKDKSKL